MLLFKDRYLNIAILVSVLWHCLLIISVNPVFKTGHIMKHDTSISFLGSILERVVPGEEKPLMSGYVPKENKIDKLEPGKADFINAEPEKIDFFYYSDTSDFFNLNTYRKKEAARVSFSDFFIKGEARDRMIIYKPDLDKSMKALEDLITRYSNSDLIPTAKLKAIDILMKKDDLSEAKGRLLKFITDYKNTAFVKVASKYLGDIMKKEEKAKDAISYYKESLDERRGDFNAGIQLTIGQLYEELGDLDSAVAEYMKVGYIYPDSTGIVSNATILCGRLLEKQGKISEAIKLYKKISDMDTKEAEFAKERLKILE